MDLNVPTADHTMQYMKNEATAYIVGGYTIDEKDIKLCLKFDIINLKFENFGKLNKERYQTGVLSCKKYLWIFGGYNDGIIVDSIERVDIRTGGLF